MVIKRYSLSHGHLPQETVKTVVQQPVCLQFSGSIHSFNFSWSKKAGYSHIQLCPANTLTEPLLFAIYSENPELHLRLFLGPSPGCTVSEHILLTAQLQVFWYLRGTEGAGPYTTHMFSPSESRDVLGLWCCLICEFSWVCGEDNASGKSFHLDCLMSTCGCNAVSI